MWKKSLIRKLGLISKFMTSQADKHIITIHVLPNISISKDDQAMKFGQSIEYDLIDFFLQGKLTPKKLVPDLSLFFKKP